MCCASGWCVSASMVTPACTWRCRVLRRRARRDARDESRSSRAMRMLSERAATLSRRVSQNESIRRRRREYQAERTIVIEESSRCGSARDKSTQRYLCHRWLVRHRWSLRAASSKIIVLGHVSASCALCVLYCLERVPAERACAESNQVGVGSRCADG